VGLFLIGNDTTSSHFTVRCSLATVPKSACFHLRKANVFCSDGACADANTQTGCDLRLSLVSSASAICRNIILYWNEVILEGCKALLS
jgi:hypothetical protein